VSGSADGPSGRPARTRARAASQAGAGRSARALAVRVIGRVTDDGAYSNLTLAAELSASALEDRDRRFATDLAYGTLRNLPSLDRVLAELTTRPLGSLDPDVRAALRMGAYQLLHTRVPPHAAVGETVALVPMRARGLVNAILRRLAADASSDGAKAGSQPDPSDGAGLSAWAVEELRRLLPSDQVEAAASALATPAPLSLRVNRGRASPEALGAALTQAGVEATPGRHDPDVLLVTSAAPATLPGYAEGWFAVQDEASVLVGAAVRAEPGERILDASAGPGGKAAHLAWAVGPHGILVAGDASVARTNLVRRTAGRLGVRVHVLAQDARRPALAGRSFDAILVDAPCSGLGAARRRPELLWRVPKDRLSGLARLQVAMLLGVADLVRPGGRLVYSVCTFPRAETDAVVRAFLAKRPDFEPRRIPGPDGEATTHRLWPHLHGTDGMFFAGFTRRPEAA
jgi:16S rRNA (cytosine967-C5)-methyltransferase